MLPLNKIIASIKKIDAPSMGTISIFGEEIHFVKNSRVEWTIVFDDIEKITASSVDMFTYDQFLIEVYTPDRVFNVYELMEGFEAFCERLNEKLSFVVPDWRQELNSLGPFRSKEILLWKLVGA